MLSQLWKGEVDQTNPCSLQLCGRIWKASLGDPRGMFLFGEGAWRWVMRFGWLKSCVHWPACNPRGGLEERLHILLWDGIWGAAEWGAGGTPSFFLPGSCPCAEEWGHGPCLHPWPAVPDRSIPRASPSKISELVLLVGFWKEVAWLRG